MALEILSNVFGNKQQAPANPYYVDPISQMNPLQRLAYGLANVADEGQTLSRLSNQAQVQAQQRQRQAELEQQRASEQQKQLQQQEQLKAIGKVLASPSDLQNQLTALAQLGSPEALRTANQLMTQAGTQSRFESKETRIAEQAALEREQLRKVGEILSSGASSGRDKISALASIGTPEAISAATQLYKKETEPLLTKAQDFETKQAIEELQGARSAANQILERVEQDPSSAGIVGLARRGAEIAGGVLSDVGKETNIPGLENVGKAVTSWAGDDEKTVGELKPLENRLAYGLARARKGTGKLAVTDVENARKDINLLGLTSSPDVKNRIGQVLNEINEAEQGVFRLRGEGSGLTPPTPKAEGSVDFMFNPQTGKLEKAK